MSPHEGQRVAQTGHTQGRRNSLGAMMGETLLVQSERLFLRNKVTFKQNSSIFISDGNTASLSEDSQTHPLSTTEEY